MVAAIVIPLIFLYFLIVTIKERRRKYEEYLTLDKIKEEALLTGVIHEVTVKTRTFVRDHSVSVTTLLLVDENYKRYKAVRTSPLASTTPSFLAGTSVTCYGYWEKDQFIFYRYKENPK
ncbi:hypothetical protein [Bacillus sp. AK128]